MILFMNTGKGRVLPTRLNSWLRAGARCAHPSVMALAAGDAAGRRRPAQSSQAHLEAAIGWIRAAHDQCGRRGVSAGYSLRHGWLPPYPETTGYIIPTLLDYAKFSGKDEYVTRARAMADWECDVQLDSGGVMGGVYRAGKQPPPPVVFNTGQVILGWVRASRDLGVERYLEAARRAGNWLLQAQSDDGSWTVEGVETGTPVHAYDARTAWSLLELHDLTGESSFAEAAKRNLEWTLAQQQKNGWYANNAFYSKPGSKWSVTFTHTIAYVMEGLLGAWRFMPDNRYLDAARRTAEKLLRIYELRHFMAGDYDGKWRSRARYSCLTGDAQIAGVWLELYGLSHDTRYLSAALKLNDYVKSTQRLNAMHPGIRGGIKGSQPVWGVYTPFTYVNWGAKFAADAFMLEEKTMAGFEAAVQRGDPLGPQDVR